MRAILLSLLIAWVTIGAGVGVGGGEIAGISAAHADDSPGFHLPPKPVDDPWPDVTPMAVATVAAANADPKVQRGYQIIMSGPNNLAGNEAAINFRFAADHGNVVAQAASCAVDLANSRGEGQMTWALRRCRPAADQGLISAQLMVGLLLQVAGPEFDPRKSVHWLRQAAVQGDPLAVAALAEAYLSGTGVPADRKIGLDLLQQVIDGPAGGGSSGRGLRQGTADYALYLRDDRPGNTDALRQAGRAKLKAAATEDLWLAQLRLSWLSRTGAPGVPQDSDAARLYGDDALVNLIRDQIAPGVAGVTAQ